MSPVAFPETAVVILNYNGEKFLRQFLPSVIAHTPASARIIVADNASTDGSVIFLETEYPDLELIKLKKNTGYAGGYQEALQLIKAKYYVLLNSDVRVPQSWLEPLIELMESDPKIAACQPKIKAFHDPQSFEYAGAAGGMIDWLGFPFCRGRIFDYVQKDTGQYAQSCPIFWASGACMVVRASTFWQIGGFDTDFFAHMEEIDWCWRIKNAGYSVWYCADSEVFHVGGGTLQYGSPFKTYLNFRNNLVMMLKNLPFPKVIPIVWLRMVLDGVAGIRFIGQGQAPHCWAIIRSHFYLYANCLIIRQKRKKALAQAQQFDHAEIYPKSIVWEHFVSSSTR